MRSSILQRLPASMMIGSGRMVVVTIEFAAIAYLMRRLGPEPFGLVAMAMALIVAFEVIGDGGAGASLVSDRKFSAQHVGAAFVIAMGIGLFLMLLALAATPLVVAFYDDTRIGTIWVVACVLMGLSSLFTIPKSIAQRDQRFWLLSWMPVFAQLMAAVAAISLAQVRNDFWPLLVYHAVAVSLRLVSFWLLVRPGMRWPAKDDLVHVFKFGRGMVGFNILNTLSRYADNIIVGRFLGERALGLYLLAYRVLMLPLREIGGLINTLAYPRLSRLAPDWPAVGRGLAAVMCDVAIFTTPFCLGTAIAAPEIISVIFGKAWTGALIPLQVLALLGIYQAPFAQIGLAYTVSRETGVMARWEMLFTPAIVLSFFAGLPWGIEGVAVAYALTSIALAVPSLRIGASVLGISPLLLVRGGLVGIGIGLLGTLPLIITYVTVKSLGLSSITMLILTIIAGALGELGLYTFAMRRRKRVPAAW